jgi:hypothetical protein
MYPRVHAPLHGILAMHLVKVGKTQSQQRPVLSPRQSEQRYVKDKAVVAPDQATSVFLHNDLQVQNTSQLCCS